MTPADPYTVTQRALRLRTDDYAPQRNNTRRESPLFRFLSGQRNYSHIEQRPSFVTPVFRILARARSWASKASP